MIKLIVFLGSFLFSLSLFSQEVGFSLNIKDFHKSRSYEKMSNFKNFNGRIFKINNNNLLRVKMYGREYFQFTYLREWSKISLRTYLYYNFYQPRITPAISIRYKF